MTFTDSGAHVSQIRDASLQTHLLAHWVRANQALTLEQAVRMLSIDNATHWGFADRGLIREGFAADLVVFDPATVGPEMPEVAQDLPAGARRLVQRAAGRVASTSHPLSAISCDLGFADQPHMCRLFRRHTGLAPSEYRALASDSVYWCHLF